MNAVPISTAYSLSASGLLTVKLTVSLPPNKAPPNTLITSTGVFSCVVARRQRASLNAIIKSMDGAGTLTINRSLGGRSCGCPMCKG